MIKFVKDNLRLLQQKDFPEDYYKKIKHDYFYPLKKLIGKPKDSEIAQTTIFFMIRKHMIKDEESLNKILELPFFENHIVNSNIFFEALKLKNPNSFVVIEPSKLDNDEYVQRIEEEIRQKVINENQSEFIQHKAEYEKEIQEIKKQLALIPTKLEKQDYHEPEVKEDEEPQKQEWWQTLNLKDDPFPLAEGLQKIKSEIYEYIIVRTDIFKKFVHYADNLKDQIFKNTIFYGDFGSGKTAFFNYLKEILLRNKILSVHVTMWASRDDVSNIYNFEEKLISSLQDECKKYDVMIDSDNHKSNTQKIKDIFLQLTSQRGFGGIVIFVDDLHKNGKAFEAVLDFLSYLQIFTSEMIQGNPNIAIYVAGIPQWRQRIVTEPRLSGSLIRSESMPPVLEQDAYEMLNNRMLTFSKNTDKKNIIGRAFVKQVYDDLRQKNVVITFREFLRKAIEEFGNGNFDRVLTVNPKAIPSDTVHEIKKTLLGRPKLNYQFEQLAEITADAELENKQKCFELLGNLHLEHGLYETSPQVERNLWAIQQLERSGLINYDTDVNGVKWLVNRELSDANREIVEDYGVSMEDYLVPAFIGNPIFRRGRMKTREFEIIETISKNRIKDDEVRILKQVLELYKPLLAIDKEHTMNIAPQDLVEKCIQSLYALTSAFMSIENTRRPEGTDLQVLGFWKTFWHSPASMIEFVDQVEGKEISEINKANFIFSLYKEAFADIVAFLKNQLEKDLVFSIAYDGLTNNNCELIDKVRDMWLKKDYYEMCSMVVRYIETELREHLFNIMALIYGSREHRMDRLDIRTRDQILDNIQKDEKRGLASITNEFQFFNRKDYKIFLTKGPSAQSELGHRNWIDIFSHVFAPWTEDKLYDFLNKFGDYNTTTSHNKSEAIKESQQPELRQFAIDSMFFLQKLNDCYRKLITGYNKKDTQFFFSFSKSADLDHRSLISFSQDEIERLVKKLTLLEEILIPMHDHRYIQAFYNMDYRKFVMLISILLNSNEEITNKNGMRLSLSYIKGTDFRLTRSN